MVEESIYEGKGDQMFDDIKNGAGFATYDYVLNAKHSPLSPKERIRLMIRLAKIGILIDDRKINGNPTEKSKIPKSATMSLQDLEKRYKARTNPKENVVEMKKPNFNELEPVSGKYDFAKLSNISDMGNKVKITQKEFEEILKKLKKWGVDVFRNDADDFFTIFSYGDNYNLVKVKINEGISAEKRAAGILKNKKSREIEISKVMNIVKQRIKAIDKQAGHRKIADEKTRLESLLKKLEKQKMTPISQLESVNEETINELDKGDILQHKHNPNISIELVATTKRGWKVKETTKKGKRSKTITAYYDDQDVKGDKSLYEANHGYEDGTASYMKNHKDEYKMAIQMNKKAGKKEVLFYDELENLEEKIGHPKYMVFLSNSLRGFNVDMYKDPKIKNKSEAEEALYKLSK